MVSMGIAIMGLAIGFFLLYDIQQEKQKSTASPESLNQLLDESNQRLSIVKDDFDNGQYNGDIPIQEVINKIESEVQIQKNLLEQYKNLPEDLKIDKAIDTRFWQLGKYSWASEKSLLNSLEKQIP